MSKLFAPVIAVLLFASTALADVDMDLMQTIEEINDSLASNIALEKAEASLKDAHELAELFVVVEEFYVKQPDAADAVTISRDSLALTKAILNAVEARDFETAANSATDLSARAARAIPSTAKIDAHFV
ncbi:MAG: hypothetical protein NVV73_22700 [Cellvibrionaceae bacterium]|nr:hypothetical protein [Cellvibrionaceae bacterium]